METSDIILALALVVIIVLGVIHAFQRVMMFLGISLFEPVTDFLSNIVMPFAGAALIVLGIHVGIQDIRLSTQGIFADATVTTAQEIRSKCGGWRGFMSKAYHCERPVIAFTDQRGQDITARVLFSAPPGKYKAGQKVKALYLAQDPHKSVMIKDEGIDWSEPVASLLLGITMMAVGWLRFQIWRSGRSRR